MKVILLTQNVAGISPLDVYQSKPLIDWQLDRFESWGYEPIVVIDKKLSELLLRGSQRIEDFEIVYDTNENPSLNSQLLAGLYLVNTYCVALPVQVLAEDQKIFHHIQRHYWNLGPLSQVDWVQIFTPVNGHMLPGYPVLITPSGKRHIKSLDDFNGLQDPRIIMSPTPWLKKEILPMHSPSFPSPLESNADI